MTTDPQLSISRRWVLDNGFGSTDLPADAPPVFPAHVGKENMDLTDLGPGCAVVHYRGVAFDRIRNRVVLEADEPLLMIRAILTGRGDFVFEGVGQTQDSPERINLFVHGNPQDPCTSTHAANERKNVVGVMISASRLRVLCEGMGLPKPLEALDGRHAANAMASLAMSTASRRLFTELVSNPYSGGLARLYGEGKVLEALASIFANLGDHGRTARRPPGGDQAKIKAACEYLLSSLAEPPSQEMLAREVGLPQRQLAKLFRQMNGMTMTEWLLERKMEKATEMLMGEDMAVKEIAHHLGYSQVSTFTAAFSRRYGCPPASYRRSLVSRHFIVMPENT